MIFTAQNQDQWPAAHFLEEVCGILRMNLVVICIFYLYLGVILSAMSACVLTPLPPLIHIYTSSFNCCMKRLVLLDNSIIEVN